MRFARLDRWLAWLEGLHPREIDLGLERVALVAERMGLLPVGATVITVGGTNGKGSTIAMLDAILRASGRRTGCYTSPHLHRFNERIRIAGHDADDDAIMAAFDAVDGARGETSLSYFEFGTLAAFWLFARERADVWLLEVGLGGRLDAVNIVDADIAVLTSIGIDHTDWLGETREEIALEKVAIARPGRPLVCGDSSPPRTLLDHVAVQGIDLKLARRDYDWERRGDSWRWRLGDAELDGLPLPALAGEHQLQNAATALTALALLPESLWPRREAIEEGLRHVGLPGRFERIDAGFEVVLDVTHNPHGMARLVASLQAERPAGKTVILFGVMADKDVSALIRLLAPVCERWIAVAPGVGRALPVAVLVDMVRKEAVGAEVDVAASVVEGVALARSMLGPGDRLVVTGSFYTVAEARALLI